MRANWTSWTNESVSAFHTPLPSVLSWDLAQLLNHQPWIPPSHRPMLLSLSWSEVLNFIPLATLSGWAGAAMASPVSPLKPATLRRYLPPSDATENDAYSTEYHSPVSRWI